MSDPHETASLPPCNLCGLDCALPGCPDLDQGLIRAQVSGGYSSTPGNGQGALDDCTLYVFSLCEWCCDWLFSRCKIPPTVTDYMMAELGSEPEVFRPAPVRVQEDDWRSQKEEFFREYRRRCEARGTLAMIVGAK